MNWLDRFFVGQLVGVVVISLWLWYRTKRDGHKK